MARRKPSKSNMGCIGGLFYLCGIIIIAPFYLLYIIIKAIVEASTSTKKNIPTYSTPLIPPSSATIAKVEKPTRHFLLFESKKPLSDDEIKLLAEGRRADYINRHFRAYRTQYHINPRYRESLDRDGRWDKISVPYYEVFSFLTELLRYKRHEWFVVVLANEEEAKFIWSNKGDDNASCFFSGSHFHLVELAKGNGCNTVIYFHNHPHIQERYWDLLNPSDTDLRTFNRMSETYNKEGFNFIDGLCSQGRYKIYGQMFAQNYFPAGCSVEEIQSENGLTDKGNKALHRELRELRNIKINIIS